MERPWRRQEHAAAADRSVPAPAHSGAGRDCEALAAADDAELANLLQPRPEHAGLLAGGSGEGRRGYLKGGRRADGGVVPSRILELLLTAAALAALICVLQKAGGAGAGADSGGGGGANSSSVSTSLPVTLVSYSHTEWGERQRLNLEFYLRHGQSGAYESYVRTVYTVSGARCGPCSSIVQGMDLLPVAGGEARFAHSTVTEAHQAGAVTLLRRAEMSGADYGGHNTTLQWLAARAPRALEAARFFVFVSSASQGPFLPNFFSYKSHWTQAFTGMLTARVKLVAPSLTCHPPSNNNQGGGTLPGPLLDTYTFATDADGLEVLRAAGALNIHIGKQNIQDRNTYRLTRATLRASFRVASLLYRYSTDTDWADAANWGCNDQVQPDLECSYGGISQHPFETVFVKFPKRAPPPLSGELEKYRNWADAKLSGTATKGSFDSLRYYQAVQHRPMCPNAPGER